MPRRLLGPCVVKSCPNRSDCPIHKRERRSAASNDGAEHRHERAFWQELIDAGKVSCRRCRKPIPPHDPAAWDLGHPAPKAPEHRACNRATMGRDRA